MKRLVLLILALAGCAKTEAPGALRGRVVDANGIAVRGARVTVDGPDGVTTLTNTLGEFRLGGVAAGAHVVYALDAGAHYSGSTLVDVEGNTDAGLVVIANACEDEETPPEDGEVPEDPCDWPPPPVPGALHYDLLVADTAEAQVGPWGVYGWMSDDGLGNLVVSMDFFAPGDFTNGGDYTETIANDPANGVYSAAQVGLFVQDVYGYYYVLREGEISISVDAVTSSFTFTGSNLLFDYLECTGNLMTDVNATVTQAEAAGPATIHVPPAAPTEDLALGTFVATWAEIGVFAADPNDPADDAVYVWAHDEVLGVSLSYSAYLGTLTTTPALLTGNEVWGVASVWLENADEWYPTWDYYLIDGTFGLSADLVVGDTVTLAVTASTYQFAPLTEPDPNVKVTIDSAEITAEVLDYGAWSDDPGDGSCNCPPPPEATP